MKGRCRSHQISRVQFRECEMFGFGQDGRVRQPINKTIKKIEVRDLQFEDTLPHSEKRMIIDADEGAITIEEVTVYQAGCGHLICPEQFGSHCDECKRTLCMACSFLHCRRCLKRLCSTQCAHIHSHAVYCGRCKAIEIGKDVASATGRFIYGMIRGK